MTVDDDNLLERVLLSGNILRTFFGREYQSVPRGKTERDRKEEEKEKEEEIKGGEVDGPGGKADV